MKLKRNMWKLLVHLPLEDLGEVWYMHLHAVLRFIDAQVHILELAACSEFIVNCRKISCECSYSNQRVHDLRSFRNTYDGRKCSHLLGAPIPLSMKEF